MSKHNKVNPGKYTQAGRLSPDDQARELVKQREAASPRNTEGGQFGERTQAQARVTDKDKQDADEDDQDQDDREEQEEEKD